MVNTSKLLNRMQEMNITQQDLANKCNIKRPTMCQKLHNIRQITLPEAQIIQNCLAIPDTEFGSYFFA